MFEVRREHDCPPRHFHPWLNTPVKQKPLEPLIECFALQPGWLQGRNRGNACNDIRVAAPPVLTGEPKRAHVAVGIDRSANGAFYFFIPLVKATLLYNTTPCGRIRGKDKSENARLQVWNWHFLARRQCNEFACTSTNVLTVWLWVCRWWILDAELCHKTKSELPPKSSRFSRGCWEKTGMDKWRQQMVPRGVDAIKTITKDPDLFSKSVHWIYHACVLYR